MARLIEALEEKQDQAGMLERKAVRLECKAIEGGMIEGYASLFGVRDAGGDTVMRGAYTRTLAAMAETGRRVKMLWQHDPSQPIGVWDEVREDDWGLHVKGRILDDVAKGRETIALIGAGAIDGLSIGYRTVAADRVPGGGRMLKELDIWEVSMVTFPMLQSARIDAIKAAQMTPRDMERLLTQDAGLTRSVARQLMAGGLDAIKAMQDAGDGIDELAALLRARCNIGHAKET